MSVVEGQRCPRCGHDDAGERHCSECWLELRAASQPEDPRIALTRRGWESAHPERKSDYVEWSERREGPPPGEVEPLVSARPQSGPMGLVPLSSSSFPRRPPPAAFEPLGGRLALVVVALAAVAVIDVAAAISDALELHLIDRIQGGAVVTAQEADNNDVRQALIGVVELVFGVIAAVAWLRWFHRAYRNVDSLGIRRFGTGWAIGGWFVPILSLYRPKQIANDLWAAGAADADDARPPVLLAVWWLGYLVVTQLGAIALRVFLSDDTTAGLRTSTTLNLVADVLDIAVALLAIVVARRITARLEARAAAR